ncbi:hypothetical protein HPB47_025959, partial [Ixodes persulcatus]
CQISTDAQDEVPRNGNCDNYRNFSTCPGRKDGVSGCPVVPESKRKTSPHKERFHRDVDAATV